MRASYVLQRLESPSHMVSHMQRNKSKASHSLQTSNGHVSQFALNTDDNLIKHILLVDVGSGVDKGGGSTPMRETRY